MVYAGTVDEQRFTLGVSGRLLDRNLVMWDEETGSLWSQILGVGLHGPAKGVELGMLPAVFVGLGTWQRMHPDTLVLDLSTVRARPWFYTNEDLAAGAVRDPRGRQALGIGLRHGGHTLAVALPLLHRKKLVAVEVGAVPLAVVWHDGEKAAFVYDRRLGGRTLELELRDDELRELGGTRRWDPVTAGRTDGEGPALPRFPYVPSYLSAWRHYYPEGEVLE